MFYARKNATFAVTFAIVMKENKYRFCPVGREFSAGITNLQPALCCLVDPNDLTILRCTKGFAVCLIDFKKRSIQRGDIIFIFNYTTFIPLEISTLFTVEYISLSALITEDSFYKIPTMALLNFLYENPVCHIPSDKQSLTQEWFSYMQSVMKHSCWEYQHEILKGGIYNFTLMVYCEVKPYFTKDVMLLESKSWTLMTKFQDMLMRHYRMHKEVDYYADKLFISTDYLYKITTSCIGMSPKMLIFEQLVWAMKTLLTSTELSIKNISEELGFEDASYMCRFFRKQTGMSPVEFRNTNNKR